MTPATIREIRRRLSLKQRDLALRLRVSVVTVSRWERGESKPLPALAAALRSMAERLDLEAGHAGTQ